MSSSYYNIIIIKRLTKKLNLINLKTGSFKMIKIDLIINIMICSP